ncbi:hypothetical protein IC582_009915 [Cucumis melo]
MGPDIVNLLNPLPVSRSIFTTALANANPLGSRNIFGLSIDPFFELGCLWDNIRPIICSDELLGLGVNVEWAGSGPSLFACAFPAPSFFTLCKATKKGSNSSFQRF